LTVKLAKMSNAKIKNAQIRIVQPKPTCPISWVTMQGKMTPPREEPPATRPIAIPRFFRNQVDTF
jgi:hypothetical protein